MKVSAIVAVSENGIIGVNNGIPWYLSGDLKFFKKITMGHHIIMGRKSFESIGKPLPGRTNIIITRDLFYAASGCLVVHSLEEALTLADENGETEAIIIGGGQIYSESMGYVDKIYLTEVKAIITTQPGDDVAYFPKIEENDWLEVSRTCHQADEKNDHDWCIKILERK